MVWDLLSFDQGIRPVLDEKLDWNCEFNRLAVLKGPRSYSGSARILETKTLGL